MMKSAMMTMGLIVVVCSVIYVGSYFLVSDVFVHQSGQDEITIRLFEKSSELRLYYPLVLLETRIRHENFTVQAHSGDSMSALCVN